MWKSLSSGAQLSFPLKAEVVVREATYNSLLPPSQQASPGSQTRTPAVQHVTKERKRKLEEGEGGRVFVCFILVAVSVVVAASRAAWCTPTSLSQRSSPARQLTTPSWTSRARWWCDRDTGFEHFYSDEQGKKKNNDFLVLYLWSVLAADAQESAGIAFQKLPWSVFLWK